MKIAGVEINVAAAVGIIALFVVIAIGARQGLSKEGAATARGPFPLGEIEKAFNDNPADATAKYGNGPILFDGMITGVFQDRVTLGTIYLLNVQAYFSGPPSGLLAGQTVRLRCEQLEAGEIGGGTKPSFKGCVAEQILVNALPVPVAKDAKPRFDPAAVEAMRKQLLAEPKIHDLVYQDGRMLVEWQIGVMTDGTSRIGYAQYVCGLLAEKGLVDEDTDVRIVDLAKLNASNGDFRGASLGHVDCSTHENLGV